MRITTTKKGGDIKKSNSQKMRIIDNLIPFFCLFIVFGSVLIVTTSAQPQNNIIKIDPTKTVLGVEYKINGVWVPQISGLIEPINNSAFNIYWRRYNETDPIKTSLFYYDQANYYTVNLEVFYAVNETKTTGVFIVSWYRGDRYIGRETDRGSIRIRDINGLPVTVDQVIKVRKYQYTVGRYE